VENPNAMVKKLLFVLNRLDVNYKMSTTQYYNKDRDKMTTKYTIYKYHPKSDGEDFYSIIEVVIFLAKEYKYEKQINRIKEGGLSG